MFNTTGLDPDFIEELEIAYRNRSQEKQILSEPAQLDAFQAVFEKLGIVYRDKKPQVVNAFKVALSHADLVFVQTYIDEGYEFSMKSGQRDKGETIQGWLYAKSRTALGATTLRPEVFADKVSGFFGTGDINFADAKKFSNRYHLVSTQQANVVKEFNKEFLEAIGQTDNLHLVALDHDMLVGFPEAIYSAKETEKLFQVLSKAAFLDRISLPS